MEMKCPYCGGNKMLRVKSENGNEVNFILSATKEQNEITVHADKGIPVKLIYCDTCKMVNFELAL